MVSKTRPESYPLRRLAREYDLPYATVLLLSDWLVDRRDDYWTARAVDDASAWLDPDDLDELFEDIEEVHACRLATS